ncbi:unnamed protein product, partial [Rotaria sp. Silwood1]
MQLLLRIVLGFVSSFQAGDR